MLPGNSASEKRKTIAHSTSRPSSPRREDELLAHQSRTADPVAIVERALDALLTQVHKRETGITGKFRAQKPKSTASARRTRYLEFAERRDV